MKLYDFQEKIINEVRTAIADKHKNILIQSPTGSGKTVIFSAITKSAQDKNKLVLIITDRIELLTGTDDTLKRFSVYTRAILAGQKEPPLAISNYVAMSQTLRKRIDKPSWNRFFMMFDIVIIDESHVQEFNIYFESKAFRSDAFILGFTATPIRLKKQRELKLDYSYLVVGPHIHELITRGFLVKDKYFAPKHFDINGLGLNSFGDYNEGEMFKRFEQTISYDSVVDNWEKIANNTITIIFCTNIEHTLNTCKAFNDRGIVSKFITSAVLRPKFDPDCNAEQLTRYKEKVALFVKFEAYMKTYSGARDRIISEWKTGKFKVLVNTGIYTKGFDHKPIETVILCRATTSEALYLQMIGRGSRISPGKDHFNILDFGSNAERLGVYQQERAFSLEHQKPGADGIAPVKECGLINQKPKIDKNGNPGCGCLILASKKICSCGYIFETPKIEINIDLVYIEQIESPLEKFVNLERRAEERGYKQGWVINQVISDGGVAALEEYAKFKKYNNGWIYRSEKIYEQTIKSYREKMLKLQQKDNEIQLLF